MLAGSGTQTAAIWQFAGVYPGSNKAHRIMDGTSWTTSRKAMATARATFRGNSSWNSNCKH
jgi:hypothetical protein